MEMTTIWLGDGLEFRNSQPVTNAEQLTNDYLTINSLIMKPKLELNFSSESTTKDLTSSRNSTKPLVSGWAGLINVNCQT
jgi:hypothetical protein